MNADEPDLGAVMGFARRLHASLAPVWPELPGRWGFAAWDLDEREPVLHGADQQVEAASTIKVLIMIAALREVHDGSLALDTELRLPHQRVGGTGILRELPSVHRLPLGELLNLMIVVSDNAATNLLLETVGFDAVAECASSLGATSTRVERLLMDAEAEGLNLTTARDQALVLDLLARGSALPEDLTKHALDVLARQQIRDRLPAHLPELTRCWNKTGEQLTLRHDVGLIGDDRPRAVVAVLVDELADELSSRDYRGGPACPRIADLGSAVHEALD